MRPKGTQYWTLGTKELKLYFQCNLKSKMSLLSGQTGGVQERNEIFYKTFGKIVF